MNRYTLVYYVNKYLIVDAGLDNDDRGYGIVPAECSSASSARLVLHYMNQEAS